VSFRIFTAFLVVMVGIVGAQTPTRRSYGTSSTGGRSTGGKNANEDKLYPTMRGTVKGLDKKGLLLEEDGGNDLPLKITRKTTFWDGDKKLEPSAVPLGALVAVDVHRFPDGSLDALTVRVLPTPKPRE
jgi:hypothetical protein